MKNAIVLAVAALALVMGVAAPHTATRADPHGFSTRIDNTWFPLKPGARYTYSGIKDGKPSRDVVVVTHRTKTIQGAPCVAVGSACATRANRLARSCFWVRAGSAKPN